MDVKTKVMEQAARIGRARHTAIEGGLVLLVTLHEAAQNGVR